MAGPGVLDQDTAISCHDDISTTTANGVAVTLVVLLPQNLPGLRIEPGELPGAEKQELFLAVDRRQHR